MSKNVKNKDVMNISNHLVESGTTTIENELRLLKEEHRKVELMKNWSKTKNGGASMQYYITNNKINKTIKN